MRLFEEKLRLKLRWLKSVKPLCWPSIRNCWPVGLWLGKQKVDLLDFLLFCLVSALFSAYLIFFPSSESLAIGSTSYSATMSQPNVCCYLESNCLYLSWNQISQSSENHSFKAFVAVDSLCFASAKRMDLWCGKHALDTLNSCKLRVILM